MVKLSKEEVINNFLSKGYILKDDYKNNKTKMNIIDKEGYKYFVKHDALVNIIKSGGFFEKFHSNNPYSIENIKLFLKNNGSNTELLEDTYKNATAPMKWRCGKCGGVFTKTFIKIQTTTSYCQSCGRESIAESRRSSVKDKMKILNDFHIIPISPITEKTKMIDILDFETSEGYKFKASIINLSITKGGYEFIGKGNPYSLYNINKYLKDSGHNSTAIDFKSARETITFKCNCGKTFDRVWSTVLAMSNNVCNHCTNTHDSSYSTIVEKWLKEHNLRYTKEQTFEDCKNIFKLPFDFYLKDKETLIEVDGEQHFSPIQFGGISYEEALKNFKGVVERDAIKNNWCKDNNKVLIRISYRDFKNNEYKNKLKMILNS